MSYATERRIALPLLCFLVALQGLSLAQESNRNDVSLVRQPWTTSRIKGSPELPLPLSIVPAFPQLTFQDPMHIRWQPELERYVVCELGGRIWSFPHNEKVTAADLMIDLKTSLKSFDPEQSSGCEYLYSIAFDPDFSSNRFIYVCMILSSKTGSPLPDGSRVSRFRITEQSPPEIDVNSELPIITWLAGGHNGCDLAFDDSECLLISTGDATEPSPPDRLKTGQDISDLLASILRIDVRGATKEQPYVIPEDNPFVDVANARGEVWAFGFRNPWRIAFDAPSGVLYLGDVGWEKWELIHKVVRGGNYGWSVREGSELLQPNAPMGPGPILPTRVELPHAESASITGGFVYRGKKLSMIAGQYLFGDWTNGRVWSLPLDDTSLHREVASGQLRIIAFAPDRDGEPLLVNHLTNTTMFRLVENAEYETELVEMRTFPQRLSQTGLFKDVAKQEVNEGVRRFEINHQQWHDGAHGEYFIALPELEKVTVYDSQQPIAAVAMFNSRLHYPSGTVLAKTLSFPTVSADESANVRRKTETQVLHYDGRLWHGYSYIWNDSQSDAELAPAAGTVLNLPGEERRKWRVHSRVECMQCHNPWAETTLAFNPEQLHQPDKGDVSQWLQLVREGFVVTQDGQKNSLPPEKCVGRPLSSSASDPVDLRARSYLHVNCAHCHQNNAGTAVYISLKIGDDETALKAIDVVPTKGNFGISDARLIAPGHPAQSTLLFRMASTSTGRMPHIGSREVDFRGVVMVSDWIQSLSEQSESKANEHEANLPANVQSILDSDRNPVDGAQVHNGRLQLAFATAIELARIKAESNASKLPIPPETVSQLASLPDPVISSLFEAFVPPRERQRRLSLDAKFDELADVQGDAAAGQKLFFDQDRSQCSKCHRVGDRGGQVGPDLALIGKKLSPPQLFEALIDPSRVIEPKYQTHTVLLNDGKVVTGLLDAETTGETTGEITLVTAQGEKVSIAIDNIESRKLANTSLMPTGLGTEMTAQQVADLLAYLTSLK
jgi:putative heme-binding domain-containing protein